MNTPTRKPHTLNEAFRRHVGHPGIPRPGYSRKIRQLEEYERILYELRHSTLKRQVALQFRIQRLRQRLTQEAVARRIGLNQPEISRLETMQTNPTLEFLQKVAQALNCSLWFQLDEINPKVQKNQTLRREALGTWGPAHGEPYMQWLDKNEDFRWRLRQNRQFFGVEMPGNEPGSEKSS